MYTGASFVQGVTGFGFGLYSVPFVSWHGRERRRPGYLLIAHSGNLSYTEKRLGVYTRYPGELIRGWMRIGESWTTFRRIRGTITAEYFLFDNSENPWSTYL